MGKLKIFNANIITPDEIISGGCVLVKNGKIEAVLPHDIAVEDYVPTDASNLYLAPGLIDIHVHGSGGFDCMDNTADAFLGLARSELLHGATTIIPTSIACSHEKLKDFVRIFETVRTMDHNGADMPGLHLEGPYIAMAQKGALEPQYVKPYDAKEYNEILDLSEHILRWSGAPELSGAEDFAKTLTSRGVLCAFGHTEADCALAERAISWGFTHVTHLYSSMNGTTRVRGLRKGGMVEAAYLRDEISVEIICDGMHLPAELIRLAVKTKGTDRTVLITDAMRAAGLGEGLYPFGDRNVIVKDGVAWLPDFETFAGSVATPDVCIRTVTQKAGIRLVDAVKMMTLTPARLCGLEHLKGSISAGKDADIILFDKDINIRNIFKKGIAVI